MKNLKLYSVRIILDEPVMARSARHAEQVIRRQGIPLMLRRSASAHAIVAGPVVRTMDSAGRRHGWPAASRPWGFPLRDKTEVRHILKPGKSGGRR